MSNDLSAKPDANPALSVEHCNCVALRRASRRVSLYYDACLAPSGIRSTQFAMMVALDRGADLSVQKLASVLDMDRSTAGQNVKLLERDRLIEVVRSQSDGRARLIRLTKEGRDRLVEARILWEDAQRRFEEANGPANTATIRTMVKRLEVPNASSEGLATA